MRTTARILLVVLTAAFAVGLTVATAMAATFTVNSTTDAPDTSPGNGTCATSTNVCTLRAAVQEANALSGADTISLPAGTYTLTQPGIDEDNALNGDLDIKSDLTITGAGSATTTITTNASGAAGTFNDRVFDLPYLGGGVAHNVTISGVTISNGRSPSGEYGAGLNDNQDVGTTTKKLTLSNVVLTNNRTNGAGGGGLALLSNATLTNVTAGNNVADNGAGGGIWATGDAKLTMTNVSLTGNQSIGYGGGGLSSYGPMTWTGGTVSNNTSDACAAGIETGGTSTLSTLTISGNTSSFDGGGVCNEQGGVLTLKQSTINGNAATNGGSGGGIWTFGTITVYDTTIVGNSATLGGGIYDGAGTSVVKIGDDTIANNLSGSGLYTETGTATAKMANVIFSSNAGGNCGGVLPYSAGYNIDSGTSCHLTKTGDKSSTNAQLGPLQNNGGSTQTMAIPATSPAVDAGTNTYCPPVDQRGQTRPVDGNGDSVATCDIGAYEFHP